MGRKCKYVHCHVGDTDHINDWWKAHPELDRDDPKNRYAYGNAHPMFSFPVCYRKQKDKDGKYVYVKLEGLPEGIEDHCKEWIRRTHDARWSEPPTGTGIDQAMKQVDKFWGFCQSHWSKKEIVNEDGTREFRIPYAKVQYDGKHTNLNNAGNLKMPPEFPPDYFPDLKTSEKQPNCSNRGQMSNTRRSIGLDDLREQHAHDKNDLLPKDYQDFCNAIEISTNDEKWLETNPLKDKFHKIVNEDSLTFVSKSRLENTAIPIWMLEID